MSDKKFLCELCGEPMPKGEEMFKFHGYSGPCPKPPKPAEPTALDAAEHRIRDLESRLAELERRARAVCRSPDNDRHLAALREYLEEKP
jgi:hypothetical protein